jgi:hypothetical protein
VARVHGRHGKLRSSRSLHVQEIPRTGYSEGNTGYSGRVAGIWIWRGRRRAGVEERQPPMALPRHSHCLGRHLSITLVVPCMKYRLWSVAVTICKTNGHAHILQAIHPSRRPAKPATASAREEAQGWRAAGARRALGRSRSTTWSARSDSGKALEGALEERLAPRRAWGRRGDSVAEGVDAPSERSVDK